MRFTDEAAAQNGKKSARRAMRRADYDKSLYRRRDFDALLFALTGRAGITAQSAALIAARAAETIDAAALAALTGDAGAAFASALSDAALTAPAAGLAALAARFTAAPPDLCHVLAVLADTNTALAASLARFFTTELMRRALLMGRTAALAGDFALAFGIHCGKSAFTFTILLTVRHGIPLLLFGGQMRPSAVQMVGDKGSKCVNHPAQSGWPFGLKWSHLLSSLAHRFAAQDRVTVIFEMD